MFVNLLVSLKIFFFLNNYILYNYVMNQYCYMLIILLKIIMYIAS